MFELLFLALIVITGGVLMLKVLFFLLGLVFTSVGFFLKILVTGIFGLLLLPLGALFSGGFLFIIAAFIALGALIRERAPEERRR